MKKDTGLYDERADQDEEKRQTARHILMEFQTSEDTEKISKAIREQIRLPRKEKDPTAIRLGSHSGCQETVKQSLPRKGSGHLYQVNQASGQNKIIFRHARIPLISQTPILKKVTWRLTQREEKINH